MSPIENWSNNNRSNTNGSLKHAWKEDGIWTTETVHDSDSAVVGFYTAIVIGYNGMVHIVYQDATNKDLMHAQKNPAGRVMEGEWQIQNVEVIAMNVIPAVNERIGHNAVVGVVTVQRHFEFVIHRGNFGDFRPGFEQRNSLFRVTGDAHPDYSP